MKKIKIVTVFLILFVITISFSQNAYATIDSVISNMSGVTEGISGTEASESGIGKVINIIIGLMQVAGSGISLIVVTMMGIKYILASADEKADVKKQIMPIIIGCILLFGAVNLMAALEEFALNSFK